MPRTSLRNCLTSAARVSKARFSGQSGVQSFFATDLLDSRTSISCTRTTRLFNIQIIHIGGIFPISLSKIISRLPSFKLDIPSYGIWSRRFHKVLSARKTSSNLISLPRHISGFHSRWRSIKRELNYGHPWAWKRSIPAPNIALCTFRAILAASSMLWAPAMSPSSLIRGFSLWQNGQAALLHSLLGSWKRCFWIHRGNQK